MRLIVLMLLCCQSAFAQVTVIHNVKGYTLSKHAFEGKPQIDKFSAIAIENDLIKAVGDDVLIKRFKDAALIDGEGQVMLPGIIDAHGHLKNLGMNMLRVDVRGINSLEDTLKKVKNYAEQHKDLPWIIGRGWNQVLWQGKQFPTAADLDKVIADRPVVLTRIDGHAIWANSKAMEIAAIDKESRSPFGGEIIRLQDGSPSGVFIDLASSLVSSFIPKPDENTLTQAFNLAQQQLLSEGITGMHDAGIDYMNYELYRKLDEQNQLDIRIYAMLSSSDNYLRKMLEQGVIEGNKLTIRSVKAYADGALGSRGAAMLQDYSDQKDHKGLMLISEQGLQGLAKSVSHHGFQLNVHAIGDAANRLALDVFESQLTSQQRVALRPRVEHAQVIDVNDLARFKSLNIIASMQPVHATSDMNMAGDRVGEARLVGAYAWRTILDQGTVIASGSDFPVELSNPWHGLHAAVTRQNHQNQPKDGWRAKQQMQVAEALRSFTLDAAYAGFMEDKIGSLTAGKQADFILLDADPFTMDSTKIWEINVNQTWVAGEMKYQK